MKFENVNTHMNCLDFKFGSDLVLSEDQSKKLLSNIRLTTWIIRGKRENETHRTKNQSSTISKIISEGN